MTNGDYIRGLSDKELADFLDGVEGYGFIKGWNDDVDEDPMYGVDWLRQPYKE